MGDQETARLCLVTSRHAPMATNLLNSLPAVVTVTQQALLASHFMSCMYLHAPPVLSALECTGNDEQLLECISISPLCPSMGVHCTLDNTAVDKIWGSHSS